MNYEELQDRACKDGIDVMEYSFDSANIKGLYCDGVIALNKDMNPSEKACVLAEEIDHHCTSSGNIF